jgi:hypothetical protein
MKEYKLKYYAWDGGSMNVRHPPGDKLFNTYDECVKWLKLHDFKPSSSKCEWRPLVGYIESYRISKLSKVYIDIEDGEG